MVLPLSWGSLRGFPFPLLSLGRPHMSHPHSQDLCPHTCLQTPLPPMCHLVSTEGLREAGVVLGKGHVLTSIPVSPSSTPGSWGCVYVCDNRVMEAA